MLRNLLRVAHLDSVAALTIPMLVLMMAFANRTNAAPRVVTLTQAIDLAQHNNLDLAAKRTGLDAADARERQASAAGWPKLSAQAVLAPIYSATGNAVSSEVDYHRWGAWLQSTVTILQPVYTWGKLSGYREAAARATEVAKAQYTKDTNDLVYEIKELYYGAILVEQLYQFLLDGKNDVQEVLTKTEEDQKKKRPTVAKRDYYRLKIFSTEADFRLQEAEKLRYLARHALSLKLGFDPNEETIPNETSLSAITADAPSEQALVEKMQSIRPEFKQLENGIAAKQALLEVEAANKYPMFFIGGMLNFAYSNVRDTQQSAYAFDPYNRQTGGVGAGLQWSWDFATTLANQAAIRVEIDELQKKQAYARVGFRMELKKALAELKQARSRYESSLEAFQVGRKWLVSESMGYTIGTTDVKNLIDAYLARAKTAKDLWDATYKLNMSWAELTKTVGIELTPTR